MPVIRRRCNKQLIRLDLHLDVHDMNSIVSVWLTLATSLLKIRRMLGKEKKVEKMWKKESRLSMKLVQVGPSY